MTGRPERVLISDSTVVTSRSLRVGSTVEDLRRQLGTLSAGYDDAGVYVWASRGEKHLSYLLALRISSMVRSPDDIADHPNLIPDSAHVKTIILTQTP